MTKRKFELTFEGYWRERDSKGLPSYSGIYAVLSYSHDPDKRKVVLHNLLYIGRADNIKERINIHEKWCVWKNLLKAGEELCFCCTPVPKEDRERIAAALIYANQPLINTEYKNKFMFDTTVLNLYGNYGVLKEKTLLEY